MKITFDTSDLKKLDAAMSRYSQIMPTQKANTVLRRVTKPMLRRAQAEVPVSSGGRERISLKKRGNNANSYRQGGATRRDLRQKTVTPGPNEVGRILVGVSKSGNKVGWRTVFIERGTKMRRTKAGANRGRMTANNFLQRTFDGTIDGVRTDFQKEYREAFVQWARSTWPQIGV